MIGGQSFFDRREVKDLLAYLTVFVHPEDDVNLLRVINTPPRGISHATSGLALEESREMECSIWETLGAERFRKLISTRALTAVDAFRDMVVRYAAMAKTDYGRAATEMFEEIDYEAYLKRGCKTPEESLARLESVKSLLGDLKRHRQSQPGAGLQGFLDDVVLDNRRDDDGIDGKTGVSLITLHAAKGLEFPVVYLVGLEEGILPHRRALDEGESGRDEERRLFYVGITRAMRSLTMTYCMMRKKWGQMVSCQPSSLLSELDPKWIEEINYEDLQNVPSTAEEREEGMERFRAMLEGIEDIDIT
jgi:superfamily I DNA/RNA helicase